VDEHGYARWATCANCGGDGPVSPCQECTKDPKPCKLSNAQSYASAIADSVDSVVLPPLDVEIGHDGKATEIGKAAIQKRVDEIMQQND